MLIAAAAFTLVGCAKTETETPENSNEPTTLKFIIRNADEGSLTKALLGTEDGKKFLNWEDGDQIGTYCVGTFSQQSESKNNAGTVEVDGDNYTLNVQTTNGGTVNSIYSYYPYSGTAGKEKTAAIVTIPESQTMTADGFNADAMPMAGSPVTGLSLSTTANTDKPCGTINFNNLGALICFKVYSTNETSETLTSVKYITTGNVGGTFSIDLTGVDAGNEETLALTSVEAQSELTTTYSTHPAIGTGKANAIDVYMVVAPGTYSGTKVVVTTNAHTYTLNASGDKTFTRSHIKPMYVDISSVTPGALPIEETWSKVTSSSNFTPGTYYILRADESYYLSNATASSAPGCVSYTSSSTIPAAMRWSASSGTSGLVFESCSNAGYYLQATGNTNNAIRVSTTSSEWSYSKVEKTISDVQYTYHTATAGNSRYLTSYGNQDWRYYDSSNINSTNIPAEFYKRNNEYAVAIKAGIEHGSVTTSPKAFALAGETVTLTATPDENYLFSSWNVYKTGDTETTISVNGNNQFTMPAYGVTVSATFTPGPSINAEDINVSAIGATNATASYTVSLFDDDVYVSSRTGCVTAATIENHQIKYSVNPNYGTEETSGTIVLSSTSSAAPAKTVNVTQSGDTFSQSGASGNPLVLTIPAKSSTASFTVTSAVFGYNTSVTQTTNLSITTGATGSASNSPQTITVSSSTAAPTSGDPVIVGTVYVYRNNNASDAQKITITVKKAVDSGTPSAGTVLWTDTFGTIDGPTTGSFTDQDLLSVYTTTTSTHTGYSGRSGYQDNTDVTLTASNNNVRISRTTGGNCTSAHLWFVKSENATVTTSAIRLYGATSLVLSYDQGTNKSQLTAGYSTDGGSSWTDFTSSGAASSSTNSYNFTVPSNTASIILRFVHSSSNAYNTRFDNPTLTVGN